MAKTHFAIPVIGFSFGILAIGWTPASNLAALQSTLCVFGGFVLALSTLILLFPPILGAITGNPRGQDDGALYGLDHGKLNVELPPPSMWMNMGYWKDTTDFPTACRALLLKVLTTADLLDGSVVDDSIKLRSDVHILDVGFGCGDQTSSLVRLAREVKFQYVGVTLNRVQWQFAQNRLTTSKQCDAHDVKIFCADAAKPESWDVGLSTAAQAMAAQRKTDMDGKETGKIPAVWVLALDTLYHFSPSRAPIFTLAARELGASFMAFDIIRSDSATFLQIMLLKLAALVSGCPSNAFVTEKEYRDMLGQAGYDADGVEILDITPHVFQPLARFMKRRETDLGAIGLKMGALKAAGGLFGWWARTGVVKGVVVIARRD